MNVPSFLQPEYNREVCPKTFLAESILCTILCCVPLGIIALLSASKVETLYKAGNYDEAYAQSAKAGQMIFYGVLAGVAVTVICAIIALIR